MEEIVLNFDSSDFSFDDEQFYFFEDGCKRAIPVGSIDHIDLHEQITAKSYYGKKTATIFSPNFVLKIVLKKKSSFDGNKKDLKNLESFKTIINCFHKRKIPINVSAGSKKVQKNAMLIFLIFTIAFWVFIFIFAPIDSILQKLVVLLAPYSVLFFHFFMIWNVSKVKYCKYIDIASDEDNRYFRW